MAEFNVKAWRCDVCRQETIWDSRQPRGWWWCRHPDYGTFHCCGRDDCRREFEDGMKKHGGHLIEGKTDGDA